MRQIFCFSFLVLGCFLLTQCSNVTTDAPREVVVYEFDQPRGNERALGSLADPDNFDSMVRTEAENPLDELPFNRYDRNIEMAGGTPSASVFIPTTVYRAEGG